MASRGKSARPSVMAYAVIRTGGKQYRVAPGDVLRIERLAAEVGGRAGNLLGRQCGPHVPPGPNVGLGRDFTLFALCDGTVLYERLGKERRRARIVPAPQA